MGLVRSSHIRRPVLSPKILLIALITITDFYIRSSNYVEATTPAPAKKHPSAKAYGSADKKPPFAEYSNDPGLWKNIKAVLTKNKMKKLSTLCVTGTYAELLCNKANLRQLFGLLLDL